MMRTTKTLKSIFLRAWGKGKVANLLTVVVALTLATVTPALAANGGNFLLGKANVATAITGLTGTVAGPALQVYNPSTSTAATAALFRVASGHPPFKVNSATKVANLNADKLDDKSSENFLASDGKAADSDKLDGSDSTAFATGVGGKATDSDKLDGKDSTVFGQPFAFGTVSSLGIPITAASDNYIMVGSLTPPVSGKCLVTASTQIASNSSNTSEGPYYRLAIQKGASAPVNDGFYGHYFQPFSVSGFARDSSDLTRSFIFDVNSGESVRFGVYLGGAAPDWVGDSAYPHLTYTCVTPSVAGGGAAATSAPSTPSAEEKAKAEEQDAQAKEAAKD
jgi:hypothetical protein